MKVALYKPETEDVSVCLYVNEVCSFIDFGCSPNLNCPTCNGYCP
jgi:hypothetical protein